MYVIARPINGISLNGNEYALNVDGTQKTFVAEDEAKQFLYDYGDSKESVAEDLRYGALQISPFL